MSAPRCPACGAPSAEAATRLRVPLLLNVLARDGDAARRAPRGELAPCGCDACGLLWNDAFGGVEYDARYHLDATGSPRQSGHLDAVAARVAALLPSGGGTVVELGCGQGDFLARIARAAGPRLRAARGFDPAYRGGPLAPGVAITPAPLDAYTVGMLDTPPDVVVARHLIEHVPDPVAFLAELRALTGAGAALVLETPDAAWTLARGLLHDLCYEHCALHTATSLARALERAGLPAPTVEPVFGGEYLLAVSASPGARAAAPQLHAGTSERLGALTARFVAAHRERLERDAARGPVVVWGAAGKGALFLDLCDPERRLVTAAVDIDAAKQGTFLPGAGHPIVAPAEARARGVRTIAVANGSYAGEVAQACARAGWAVDLWSVGAPA